MFLYIKCVYLVFPFIGFSVCIYPEYTNANIVPWYLESKYLP